MEQLNNYTVKIRIWIEQDEDAFLGWGRIQLLENIQKTGSITNAAKEMNMSYRKAWELVKKMNDKTQKPLVEKIIGGRTGSGAKLTKEGEMAIEKFYNIENDIKSYIQQKYKKLIF